jgi:hypothetical protein
MGAAWAAAPAGEFTPNAFIKLFPDGMVSIVAILAVADCLSLDPNAGAEVSGHARG